MEVVYMEGQGAPTWTKGSRSPQPHLCTEPRPYLPSLAGLEACPPTTPLGTTEVQPLGLGTSVQLRILHP